MDSGPETFSIESEMGVKPYVRMWPGPVSSCVKFYRFLKRIWRYFDFSNIVSECVELYIKMRVLRSTFVWKKSRAVLMSYARVIQILVKANFI